MVVLLAVSAAHAQVQVHLSAEPEKLGIGQTGRARLTIVTRIRRGPKAPTRPPAVSAPDGLTVTYVGQSQQYSNRNGVLTQVNQFEYQVGATRVGEWSLGPVDVALSDGSTVQTNAVTLDVVPREDLQASRFEVSASFSEDEVWEGEVVLYRFRFRSKADRVSVEWRHPRFDGVRLTQQGKPDVDRYVIDDPEGRITVEEGVVPLIATGTGVREQGPAIASVGIPVGPSRGLRLLQRVRTEQFATDPIQLVVRPLPDPPPDFSGLVGDFVLDSKLAATRATVGQSVSWTLSMRGDGALEGFFLPPYEAEHVSLYEGDIRLDAGLRDGRFVARAEYDRVVVPTEPGTWELPPFELITFSPSRGDYVTHRVEMPPLVVSPGREGEGAVTSFAPEREDGAESAAPEDMGPVPRDIIRSGAATTLPTNAWLPWLLGLFGAPGLGLLGWDGMRRVRAWWSARRAVDERPATAVELLARAPASGPERWAALEGALRRALEEGRPPDVVQPLLDRIGRQRFAPGSERDASLDDEVCMLIRATP